MVESSRLRVERKALVSIPTLNQKLSTAFKELLPQFHAQLPLQPLANLRVDHGDFVVRQCASFVAICQRICHRLFSRAETLALAPAENVEQLHPHEKRFVGAPNCLPNFF